MGEPFNGYGGLITAAHNGQITIEMSPDGFDRIDKVLGRFIDGLDRLQDVVDKLAQHDDYGLGRHPDATSAPALEAKLKAKARGGPNSALDTIIAYTQAAGQLRQLFQASRQRYTGKDNETAAALFKAVENIGKA